MLWIVLALFVIVCSFGIVVFFGAPYLPTLKPQAKLALEMIGLEPGDTLIELGSGDGRVLLMAAAAGLNAVGIEMNPILVIISRLRTRHRRKQIRVIWGNFWQIRRWPEAEGIFVFLLPKYMQKLDNKITQWQEQRPKPIVLVSFAFIIPGKRPSRQDKRGVYLYEYR